ncbi:LOW QUALITY PROTEIN: N-alpha-acetyltransferase 38, NatC auxiliary subunit-like [Callospermophilus lateralis]
MDVAAGDKAVPALGLARTWVLGLRGSRAARWGGGGRGRGTAAPGSLWASECPVGCWELWFRRQSGQRLQGLSVFRPEQDSDGEREDSPAARARQQLEALLNKTMHIRMTDGRTLVGCFLCTNRDCNVILGSAQEFLKPSDSFSAWERVLGLAMVPGHHIVSIQVQRESLAGSPYL